MLDFQSVNAIKNFFIANYSILYKYSFSAGFPSDLCYRLYLFVSYFIEREARNRGIYWT